MVRLTLLEASTFSSARSLAAASLSRLPRTLDGAPGINDIVSMLETLKQQVVLLEATCHRALQEREDQLVREGLVEALLVFYVDAPDEAPAILKGLCNVARVRADFLLASCKENDEPAVARNLGSLCAALHDVKQAIDKSE
jgi:hypothetical protein